MSIDCNNNYTVHDKMSLNYNILNDVDIRTNTTEEDDSNNWTYQLVSSKDNNIDWKVDNTWMNELIVEEDNMECLVRNL